MNSNVSEGDGARRSATVEEEEGEIDSPSVNDKQVKRRHFARHSQRQIQELEAFFKECPHPDDKQRRELSRHLGMELMKVKFWFQNKRTQMKSKNEHQENSQLRLENEQLRADNLRYREAIGNLSCPNCAFPAPVGDTSMHEYQLRMENARLRHEIEHISAIATKYVGKPLTSSTDYPPYFSSHHHKGKYRAAEVGSSTPKELLTMLIADSAAVAVEELMRMAHLGEPLWLPTTDHNGATLNEDEYMKSCSKVFGQRMKGYRAESSRDNAIIDMAASTIVQIFMNAEQWSTVFSGIVSRATTLQVISPGKGADYNDAIVVMNAEYQVPSPVIPTRTSYFLRHCKKHLDGTWVVVDFSLDHVRSTTMITCRKRASGCVIQDLPSGKSKVIWVEHVEVEEGIPQGIYKPLIASGLAFGAKRWVAILSGHSHRLAAENVPPQGTSSTGSDDGIYNDVGRKSLVKLGERMVSSFFSRVSASTGNTWGNLSGTGTGSYPGNNLKMMITNNLNDPTMPFGVHLNIATSFWLPVTPKEAFDYLRDQKLRKKWDVLLDGTDFQEMMNVVMGKEEDNHISLYRLISVSSSQSNELTMLQECRSDLTASYIVYAPVDMGLVNAMNGGGDERYIPLLPSGFVILPDGPTGGNRKGVGARADSGGSLLTVAFQVLVDSVPNADVPPSSIEAANKLISATIDNIKTALSQKSKEESC